MTTSDQQNDGDAKAIEQPIRWSDGYSLFTLYTRSTTERDRRQTDPVAATAADLAAAGYVPASELEAVRRELEAHQRQLGEALGMMHEPSQGPTWPATWEQLIQAARIAESYRQKFPLLEQEKQVAEATGGAWLKDGLRDAARSATPEMKARVAANPSGFLPTAELEPHDPLFEAERFILSCGPDEPGSSEAQRNAIMSIIDAIRKRTDAPSSALGQERGELEAVRLELQETRGHMIAAQRATNEVASKLVDVSVKLTEAESALTTERARRLPWKELARRNGVAFRAAHKQLADTERQLSEQQTEHERVVAESNARKDALQAIHATLVDFGCSGAATLTGDVRSLATERDALKAQLTTERARVEEAERVGAVETRNANRLYAELAAANARAEEAERRMVEQSDAFQGAIRRMAEKYENQLAAANARAASLEEEARQAKRLLSDVLNGHDGDNWETEVKMLLEGTLSAAPQASTEQVEGIASELSRTLSDPQRCSGCRFLSVTSLDNAADRDSAYCSRLKLPLVYRRGLPVRRAECFPVATSPIPQVAQASGETCPVHHPVGDEDGFERCTCRDLPKPPEPPDCVTRGELVAALRWTAECFEDKALLVIANRLESK